MAHPISDLMTAAMEKIRDMMDANTVIGNPIEAGGVTVIPVSKISIGYGSGGSDFAQKNQKPENPNAFGGGTGMGIGITPVAFLVIKDSSVRVLSVQQPSATTIDRVIDMVPDVVDKVSDLLSKRQTGKDPDDAFDVAEET